MIEKTREGLRRWAEEAGATAVEYGIMVALIAVVIILAVWGIGQALNSDFNCVNDALENTASAPGANC
jgi:pilus assembly protein Flp/PilA